MDFSPRLALPYLLPNQAQKHVTHNEALRQLDALVQLAVQDRDLAAPPGAPEEGQCWLVAAGATGDWAGHEDEIAAWQDGAWTFLAPGEGWLAWVLDEALLCVWSGTAWTAAPGVLQGLSRLGLGTEADATNPFAAKLNKALWTARATGEGGDGDLRYTLNKEASGNVLSLLMQSGWSGRAEIGLIGGDDLGVKVSPDGSAWHEAVLIDRATGIARFPSGGVREALQGDRTYYVDPSGSNANDGLSAGAPLATIAAAVAKCHQVDTNGHDLTIQLADGTYTSSGIALEVDRPLAGGGRLEILGNPSAPGNVIVRGVYPSVQVSAGAIVALRHFRIECSSTGSLLLANAGAAVFIDNLVFAATSRYQIELASGASLTVLGDYEIAGSATLGHISVASCAVMDGGNRTMTLTGTLTFGSQFITAASGGVCALWNATWTVTGTATGKRYSATLNGVINTFGKGATHFPGDAAGTTGSGGQYA
ncbi:MAG: DUF2793 domain-containing protein [Hyphomonas sp.]|nr:DUF2793 domain-containing protein [Hyphomonas sp.]